MKHERIVARDNTLAAAAIAAEPAAAALRPVFYLRGGSTGDLQEVLNALLRKARR